MAPRRFVEKLWQTIEDAGCDLEITTQFVAAYSPSGSARIIDENHDAQ
ncbi:hypothetical protein Pd630_LPD04710 [Rhodococcus opacus PD630]|nr:hypothetical protein Pd630_LPD04710 [Rhodococcus opacus PD630]